MPIDNYQLEFIATDNRQSSPNHTGLLSRKNPMIGTAAPPAGLITRRFALRFIRLLMSRAEP